ncbi:CinA family protein [Haladaptatus sp. F3-133]|uniref:CinA family protein n=1 Tax=Halorutilus salinus TaxID=2487751 RepID=A0A9Q4C3N2_9EURY|nr:CinA family protein [Halorutilus salinus]MCX2817869.1 CinA family protein [Halorutilus salinus]
MTTDASTGIRDELRGTFADRGEYIAVAESATGGLVGSYITDIPGASDFFDRSVVTYTYESKTHELCVSRESLDEEGAVSAQVAREMARGVRDKAGATWGVATTGTAGPTGGTDRNPVGTVYVGVAYADDWGTGGSYADAERYVFDGDRRANKRDFAQAALRKLVDEVRSVDG